MNKLFYLGSDPLAWTMLLPVFLSTGLAVRTWGNRFGTKSRIFSLLHCSIALWSLAYAFELGNPNFPIKLFWLKLEYLAIPFVPLFWFLVVLENSGSERFITRKRVLLLSLIPLLTTILAFTNPLHHLHYTQVEMASAGAFSRLELNIGPWYIVNLVYAYILTISSIFILGRNLIHREETYRSQAVILFIGALIPFLVSISYISRIFPVPNFDPLPFGFSISAAIIGYGIFRYRIFDLVPFARDHIFQNMADGAIVLDKKNRLVEANLSASIMFHWEKPPIGKPITDFFPDHPFLQELTGLPPTGVREILFDHLNKQQYFEVSFSDIPNRKGEIIGRCFVFHDINNRKRTENQLQTLIAEKDKFFSIIAHDLRSPFNAFLGLSRLMADEIQNLEKEDIQSMATTMNQAATNLYRQLENLLEWSQFQRGSHSFQPAKLQLETHIRSVVSFLEQAALQKEIRIETSMNKGLQVFADAQMTETLLLNLCSNAIKFSHRGSVIRIKVTEAGENIEISIEDQGIGIRKEDIPKLFRIDEKVFHPGTEGEPSSGLGLLLCREIVEKHGGTIRVESQPGKGSRFTFTLPVHP